MKQGKIFALTTPQTGTPKHPQNTTRHEPCADPPHAANHHPPTCRHPGTRQHTPSRSGTGSQGHNDSTGASTPHTTPSPARHTPGRTWAQQPAQPHATPGPASLRPAGDACHSSSTTHTEQQPPPPGKRLLRHSRSIPHTRAAGTGRPTVTRPLSVPLLPSFLE